MAVGNDHQMTRAVGVGVENHEAICAAKDDKVFSVVAAVGGEIAEDTALAAAFGGVEVRVSPWGHECFHVLSSFL